LRMITYGWDLLRTQPLERLRTASPVRVSNPPSRPALESALPRGLPLGNRRRGQPRQVTNSPWTRFYKRGRQIAILRRHRATQLDDVGLGLANQEALVSARSERPGSEAHWNGSTLQLLRSVNEDEDSTLTQMP